MESILHISLPIVPFEDLEILENWNGCKRPESKIFDGKYVRLEPLNVEQHLDGLHEASTGPGAEERMKYMWEDVMSREELKKWMEARQNAVDAVYFAVIDKATGKVGGRQAIHRIDEANGVAEVGHVLWGPLIARRPAATESVYLIAKYLFDDLGYRRYEWKCHHNNMASKRCAERFGFTLEGLFRQQHVMKGKSRDSIWLSILDNEWPRLREATEKWLDPDNFDENGVQKRRLEDFRS